MRFLVLILLGLVLTAPAMAQESKGQVFGSMLCQQKIPCPGAQNPMEPKDLAAAGNTCMIQSYGSSSSGGFFDENAGLTGGNCLVTKTMEQKEGSKNLTPQCCIITLKDNSCVFHCKLFAN